MKYATLSTKEIRNDLGGFLKRLKQGQIIQVLHRSKPLVTLSAIFDQDTFLSADAGTPEAARRSVRFIRHLPDRKPSFDPNQSFKDLYAKTRTL